LPLNPDYYASARYIATQLSERGEFDWSREIEDAIASGSTATEVLMSVRLTLQRLLRAGVAIEEEVTAAQSLLVALDDVLR
jgi:hypothetical protein